MPRAMHIAGTNQYLGSERIQIMEKTKSYNHILKVFKQVPQNYQMSSFLYFSLGIA